MKGVPGYTQQKDLYGIPAEGLDTLSHEERSKVLAMNVDNGGFSVLSNLEPPIILDRALANALLERGTGNAINCLVAMLNGDSQGSGLVIELNDDDKSELLQGIREHFSRRAAVSFWGGISTAGYTPELYVRLESMGISFE